MTTDQTDSASHLRLHHHADKTKRDTDYICEWCGEVDTDAMRNAITTSRTRAEKAERKVDTLTARLAAVEALADRIDCKPMSVTTALGPTAGMAVADALRDALATGTTQEAPRGDREAREAKAAAWDEGFTRGFYDILAGGDRDASESAAENPYRIEREGQA